MEDDKKIICYGVQGMTKGGKAKVHMFRPECGNDFDVEIDVGKAITDSEIDAAARKGIADLGYSVIEMYADWAELEKELYLRVKRDEAEIEAEAKAKTGYDVFRDSYGYAVLDQVYCAFDGLFDLFAPWETKGVKRTEGNPFDRFDADGVKRALAKKTNLIKDVADWYRGAHHQEDYDFWGAADSGGTEALINDYFVYGTKDAA